jgi:hypothetical protein
LYIYHKKSRKANCFCERENRSVLLKEYGPADRGLLQARSKPGSVKLPKRLGIALVYAFRKQSDEAFQWLDRAYAEHDDGLIYTKVDPLLKNLHNDPRYTALLKKLNLPN